jgi:hypothetical protein
LSRPRRFVLVLIIVIVINMINFHALHGDEKSFDYEHENDYEQDGKGRPGTRYPRLTRGPSKIKVST